ncbi:MAG: thioredoxin family protein [Phycisphaerae bacterium]|nr:thioredoxin family protein [Phycisphaerae bacterium]
MKLAASNLEKIFRQALNYNDYIATGDAGRWDAVYKAVSLSPDQQALTKSFTRKMNILVISGTWCGDCVEQCPLLARIASASDNIDLRFVDRDQFPQLRDSITVNQGTRVPVALFLAEDFELCSCYGDRSLSRYRMLAQKNIGAACSTGLFLPEQDVLAATLQDWLNEVERIHLMLRLSPRLRHKHKD